MTCHSVTCPSSICPSCSCAIAGKPLENQDILKAILLQNIPLRSHQNDRRWLVKKWSEVAKELSKLQGELKDSRRTRAWNCRNGVSITKASRGAIALDATLMDELLEHMHTLNDPLRYICCRQYFAGAFCSCVPATKCATVYRSLITCASPVTQLHAV